MLITNASLEVKDLGAGTDIPNDFLRAKSISYYPDLYSVLAILAKLTTNGRTLAIFQQCQLCYSGYLSTLKLCVNAHQ